MQGIALHSFAELEADGMIAMRRAFVERDFDLKDVQLSFAFAKSPFLILWEWVAGW